MRPPALARSTPARPIARQRSHRTYNGARRPVVRAIALILGLMTIAMSFFVPTAAAHRGDQSYLYLDVGSGLAGRLQMPFIDVLDGLGIELIGADDDATDRLIERNADALRAYALQSVEIGDEAGPWSLTAGEVRRAGEDLEYVEVRLAIDHPDNFRTFSMRLDPFFDEIDNRDALLIVANDLEGGVVDNEAEHLVRFTPDSPRQDVDLADTSQWTNFTASMAAGVDHIRTGPDHILFILALMVPSVLVWRGRWEPATGFGSTLWRVTKIMTMFTLAHSVTFTLAGIGALPSPGSKLTESVIALSIVATALHNLRPVLADKEWVIAFVFGLFHGFGFASLVNDLDVGTGTQLISLLGRNVGIEIGQLIVVLLVFPALFLLRTTPLYRPFLVASSVVLAIIALAWMFERVFETKVRGLGLIERQIEFPRSLVIVVAALVAAGAARWWFDRQQSPVEAAT